MSDLYLHKKYNYSSKIRELINERNGEKNELPNINIERIVNKVYSGEYNKLLTSLSEKDKDKFMVILKDNPPINHNQNQIDSIIRFVKDVFSDEQIDIYLEFLLNTHYKSGRIYHGIRVSNHSITNFLKTFGKTEMTKGYIINKKYVNDVINLFDIDESTLTYDNNDLMITDNIDDKYSQLRETVKTLNDVSVSDENDILVIASDNETTLEELKNIIKLDQVLIPKKSFNWMV